MSEGKTGPTFVITCDRAQDLARQIDELKTKDQDLLDLANALRRVHKGFFLMCVAPEDFILWPDGPDIRDFQLGAWNSKVTVFVGDGEYSNQPIRESNEGSRS